MRGRWRRARLLGLEDGREGGRLLSRRARGGGARLRGGSLLLGRAALRGAHLQHVRHRRQRGAVDRRRGARVGRGGGGGGGGASGDRTGDASGR